MKSKVVVIVGPTGTGKTTLSINVANYFGGEIISCDSMQIYKELNIGSAKIKKNDMHDIPHHLIDIISVDNQFSASDFSKLTNKAINEIINKNKIPILVGGTGLFVQGIIEGYDYSTCAKNELFRDKCKQIIEQKGLSFLFEMLKELNPLRASELSSNDEKRIIRALELENENAHPSSKKSDFDFIVIGLNFERDKLYNRINERVDLMIKDGLVDEVKGLFNKGYDENYQAMKGIGYKELLPYFRNEKPLETCVELIKQHSRNYAKRQITWFKKMDYIKWFTPFQQKEIIEYIEEKVNEKN